MSLFAFGAYQIKSGEKFDLNCFGWRALDFHICCFVAIGVGVRRRTLDNLTVLDRLSSFLVVVVWGHFRKFSSLPGARISTSDFHVS